MTPIGPLRKLNAKVQIKSEKEVRKGVIILSKHKLRPFDRLRDRRWGAQGPQMGGLRDRRWGTQGPQMEGSGTADGGIETAGLC